MWRGGETSVGSTTTVAVRPTVAVPSRSLSLRAKLTSPPVLLVLLLLLGAGLRLWMLTCGLPTLDSDEATFGLMALHVPHGGWSVFMWGQPYMGTIEAFSIAPFVALLGPTALTLRLAPMLLGLIFNATHGAPTLSSVLMLTVASAHGTLASPNLLAILPHNLWLELTVSPPTRVEKPSLPL